MDVIYALVCGLIMVSLSLCVQPLPTVQYKYPRSPLTENRDIRPTRNESGDGRVANKTRFPKDPHDAPEGVKGLRQRHPAGDLSSTRRTQTLKSRDKRKNCFGFKMDRISDLSGMGCKSD